MDNLVGRHIGRGRYLVVKILGSGGFGETYLAHDLGRPSSPKVVVKKFNEQFGNSNAERMFKREADALYELGEQHECIPRLHEYFIESKCFFLIQDYIEGATLDSLLRSELWFENNVIDLLTGVLEILNFIHSQGTIHCDITPRNLILRETDKKYVLIDFGAVKRIQTFSNKSLVVGTPGYMAPEHQYGNPNDKSDIYSLGIIGIQVLTGLSPTSISIDHKTGELCWRNRNVAPSALTSLLDRMVRRNYHERPSAQDALRLLQSQTTVSGTQATQAILPQQNQQRRFPWRYLFYLIAFAGIALTAIPATIIPPIPVTPSPNEPQEERQSDIQGISYAKLEELLANKSWQDAEQETNRIILQMFGRSEGSLTPQEITQIPCRDLKTIDNLWSQYSNGHFGIRIQKEVWESFQGQRNSWERTARTLGWRDLSGEPITSKDLQYDLANSPRGHLPHLEVLLTKELLPHVKQCNL